MENIEKISGLGTTSNAEHTLDRGVDHLGRRHERDHPSMAFQTTMGTEIPTRTRTRMGTGKETKTKMDMGTRTSKGMEIKTNSKMDMGTRTKMDTEIKDKMGIDLETPVNLVEVL